jgi:hypothetical protein
LIPSPIAFPIFPRNSMRRGIPIDDGEELSLECLRADVALAYGGHDGDGEEKSVGEGPSLGPGVHLSIIVKSLSNINHLLNKSMYAFLNL